MAARTIWKTEKGILWVKDCGDPGAIAGTVTDPIVPLIPVRMGEIQIEDAAILARAMDIPDPELVRERLKSARRCFAAWDGEQIAAYGWVSRGRECVGELEREIHLPANDGYIWDCGTLPAYRQKKVYSGLLGYIVGELREEGIQRIWIGTAVANRPSWQGFANAGFQPAIWLTYVRLFNVCFTWTGRSGKASAQVVRTARQIFTGEHESRWGAVALGRLPLENKCA